MKLKNWALMLCMIISMVAIGSGIYLIGLNPYFTTTPDEVVKEDVESPEPEVSEAASFDISITAVLWTGASTYVSGTGVGGECGFSANWYDKNGAGANWGSGLTYSTRSGYTTTGGSSSDTSVTNITKLSYTNSAILTNRFMGISISTDNAYYSNFGTSISYSGTNNSSTYYLYGTNYTNTYNTALSNVTTSVSGTYYINFRRYYLITYMNQGAAFTTSSMLAGEATSLTSRAPTRTGYTFKGWTDSSTASTTSTLRTSFTSAEANGNKTVYAVWEPTTYAVMLNPNGGTCVGYTGITTYNYNIEATNIANSTYPSAISLPTATRAGYIFDGWKPASAIGNWYSALLYPAGESLRGHYGTVTLVAQWSINTHYISVTSILDDIYPTNSATFDLYINGVAVAQNVSELFNEPYSANSTYEIKNIRPGYDKAFLGVTSDSAPISGTLTGDTIITLAFRTKTWNDYAATSFDSGSGTITDPYIIKTAEQLAYLSVLGQTQAITGNYKLGADIDLSGHEWCPIGVGQTYRLQGSFDGDFYSISNMTIEIFEYQLSYAGLFATVYSTGIVKNLIMKNAVINKGMRVGVISGLNDNGGTITNCVVEDSIVNSSLYGGGICGWLWTAHIYNCLVKNTTITATSAGGIFGYQGGSGQCNLTNNGSYGLTITSGGTTGPLYGGTANNVLNLNGSYAQGVVNGTNTKVMYGDSTAWSNWTFNPMLNSGYPVQTTLFHIGGFSGSAYVYNYLRNTLGFTVA